jgi:hypothetical protein
LQLYKIMIIIKNNIIIIINLQRPYGITIERFHLHNNELEFLAFQKLHQI